MDLDAFSAWIGKTETATQRADRWPIMGLCALLDKEAVPDTGAPIPPAAHWTYFGPMVPQSTLGPDGHPKRGGFLPPIPLPRRMWAGSDITFSGDIRIGDVVEKTSRIADVSLKEGKTGPLIFVKVDNRCSVDGREVLGEVQTLVYRDHPDPSETPPPGKPAPSNPDWSRRIDPDSTLLFRYSAVTFNAHRIHYDQHYTRTEEGYPDIIVHGQLIATLLLDQFVQQAGRAVRRFSFRAVKPLFAGRPFHVEGARESGDIYKLWARDAEGHLTLSAEVGV